MQITRWDDNLALLIPVAEAKLHGLTEGDNVRIVWKDDRSFSVVRDDKRPNLSDNVAQSLQIMRSLQRPLPENWTFDRNEANER